MTNTTPMKTCLAAAALLALAPWGRAQPTHKSKAAHKAASAKAAAHDWQPSAALLKQLAPDATLGDYALRPPQGYEFSVDTHEGDKDMLSSSHWAGEKRADKSQADLFVFIVAPKPGYHPDNVEKQVAAFQKSIQGNMTGVTQSPEENGSVHGIAFTRVYWKGTATDPATKQPQRVHGFTYTAVDGYTILVVLAADTEPYSQTSLPLLEAAVETLHSQQP